MCFVDLRIDVQRTRESVDGNAYRREKTTEPDRTTDDTSSSCVHKYSQTLGAMYDDENHWSKFDETRITTVR